MRRQIGQRGGRNRQHQSTLDVALQLGGVYRDDVERLINTGVLRDLLPQHRIRIDDGHFDLAIGALLEDLYDIGIGVPGPRQDTQALLIRCGDDRWRHRRQHERETEIADEAHTKPDHDFKSVEVTTCVGREITFLVVCRVAGSEWSFGSACGRWFRPEVHIARKKGAPWGALRYCGSS